MNHRPQRRYALFESPFGPLGVYWQAESLVTIDLAPRLLDGQAELAGPLARIARQLAAYFEDPGMRFDLPLQLAGTPFQRRVWTVLQEIPPGETRTYGELARLLHSSPRAIGQACRANPCPIVIPCHRVVAQGGLGGFAGARGGQLLAIKRWLLHHERLQVTDQRRQSLDEDQAWIEIGEVR